jgi:hypothetical protein
MSVQKLVPEESLSGSGPQNLELDRRDLSVWEPNWLNTCLEYCIGILTNLTLPVSSKSSQSNAKKKRCTPFVAPSPIAWNILEEFSMSKA